MANGALQIRGAPVSGHVWCARGRAGHLGQAAGSLSSVLHQVVETARPPSPAVMTASRPCVSALGAGALVLALPVLPVYFGCVHHDRRLWLARGAFWRRLLRGGRAVRGWVRRPLPVSVVGGEGCRGKERRSGGEGADRHHGLPRLGGRRQGAPVGGAVADHYHALLMLGKRRPGVPFGDGGVDRYHALLALGGRRQRTCVGGGGARIATTLSWR